jgi:hypothetical protein
VKDFVLLKAKFKKEKSMIDKRMKKSQSLDSDGDQVNYTYIFINRL